METSSKQICEDMITLIKHIKMNLEILAERYGLTNAQVYVMKCIHHGDTTMGRVAGSMHCDASNITGIIDRLVALGLVTRQESEQDRRAKLLRLTAKGQKLYDDMSREMPKALGCGKLQPEERDVLHSLITRLV